MVLFFKITCLIPLVTNIDMLNKNNLKYNIKMLRKDGQLK